KWYPIIMTLSQQCSHSETSPHNYYHPTPIKSKMLHCISAHASRWCTQGIYPAAIKTGSGEPQSEWRIPAGDLEASKRAAIEPQPIPRATLDQLMEAAMEKTA